MAIPQQQTEAQSFGKPNESYHTTTAIYYAFSESEARSRQRQGKCTAGATSGRAKTSTPTISSPAPNHRKTLITKRHCQFHSSKRCRNRSAYLGPARCVYVRTRVGAETGCPTASCHLPQPSPWHTRHERWTRIRAQVSSVPDRPCPTPGASEPLGGVCALSRLSSRNCAGAVVLVMASAKRPRVLDTRLGPGPRVFVPPTLPRPFVGSVAPRLLAALELPGPQSAAPKGAETTPTVVLTTAWFAQRVAGGG